ncbi:uncharacterized protein TM35_000851020 [Trypanosoma theileri]|uniref:Uncharacterized protein n=1 Tax=Trypanosoma theileri TaxID=67003 RepID=A0A1X0NEP0_9TRYP|nr:uncharacterized protein TM35_000851020 [Trypanosoma theileri]ORC82657.1 hypothetical protein TM35_000851020 [Trypanosoma theileri]
MSAIAEIAKLRKIAEDARREYATKSEAAKKVTAAAEKTQLQLKDSKVINSTKAKWEEAIKSRQAASEAVVIAQKKVTEWVEQTKKQSTEMATGLAVKAATGGNPEDIKKELQEETKKAGEALVMVMIDVAKEKQEEVSLLQKVYADAVREKETNKGNELDQYMKNIQNDINTKNKEASSLLEEASKKADTVGGMAKQLQDRIKDTVNISSVKSSVSNLLNGAKKMDAIKKFF